MGLEVAPSQLLASSAGCPSEAPKARILGEVGVQYLQYTMRACLNPVFGLFVVVVEKLTGTVLSRD